MPKLSTIGQRFTQLIRQLGMSKNAFAQSLDKTATVIQHLVDERNKPGFDLICKVFEVYPNVSKDWLLLGNGPMLLESVAAPSVVEPFISRMSATPVQPRVMPVAPNFPEALFTVSAARQPTTVAPPPLVEPAAIVAQAAASIIQPADSETTRASGVAAAPPGPVLPAVAPPAAATAPPAAPDSSYITAVLQTQYLQHQLALAEQRNQHLLAQQQLMQQLLDLLRRPA